MAVTWNKANDVIVMTADHDSIAAGTTFGDAIELVEILVTGSAAGNTVIEDGNGHTIADVALTSSILSFTVPVNRMVRGIYVAHLAPGHVVTLYCKKAY